MVQGRAIVTIEYYLCSCEWHHFQWLEWPNVL